MLKSGSQDNLSRVGVIYVSPVHLLFLVDAEVLAVCSNYLDKAVVKGDSKEASGDCPVDIPFRLRRILYQRLCRWTRCGVELHLQ
jgi:hypothetical protein